MPNRIETDTILIFSKQIDRIDVDNNLTAGKIDFTLASSFTKEQLDGADWFATNLATAPPETLNWNKEDIRGRP